MIINTNQLPCRDSNYDFPTILISPMKLPQLMDYEDNLPKDEVLRFIYDIEVLKKDNENLSKVLIPDIPFLVYLKMAVSISKDLEFTIDVKCDQGHSSNIRLSMDKLEYRWIPTKILDDQFVILGGKKLTVQVPTVDHFMTVVNNCSRSGSTNNLDQMKLIALFKEYDRSPNEVENSVLNATHEDVGTLSQLLELYYSAIKPLKWRCPICEEGGHGRDLLIKADKLHLEPFRLCIENNRPSSLQAILEQVREGV